MKFNPIIQKKKFTTDCYAADETLADTKDHLSDTTEEISKVKFSNHRRISVIYLFYQVELNYVICVGEVEYSNFFLQAAVLQARFSPGNSPGWIQSRH